MWLFTGRFSGKNPRTVIPLGSVIVCNASVFDPRDIVMISTEEAQKKMKSIF